MIISEKQVNQMKKVNMKFINLTSLGILASGTALIVFLLLCPEAGGEYGADVFICFGAFIAAVLSTIGLYAAKNKHVLDIVDLKKDQVLYEVFYPGLDIAAVRVYGFNPDNPQKLIVISEGEARHRDLYTDEEEAKAALNDFLEKLYKDVSAYVGYDGTVSAEDRAFFAKGYMDYLEDNKLPDPTDYDIAKVVIAIEESRDEWEFRREERETAKKSLKEHLSSK